MIGVTPFAMLVDTTVHATLYGVGNNTMTQIPMLISDAIVRFVTKERFAAVIWDQYSKTFMATLR